MDTELCALWAKLAANPDDAAAAAAVKARLVDLLEHVDDCEACRKASESIAEPEQVFARLGADYTTDLPADERAMIEAGHRSYEEAAAAIEDAVSRVLVPSLPALARPPRHVPAMKLFLATDAVNLLARSMSAEHSGALLELSAAGLRANDELVSQRADIVGEIAEHAGVEPALADDLFTWQLAACEACPSLYRGLLTFAFQGSVMLSPVPPKAAEELAEHWAVVEAEPVPVGAGLKELFPEYVFEVIEDAGTLLAGEAPALAQMEATLQQSGDEELGQFLVEQVEEEKQEKAEFVQLLKSYEKSLKIGTIKNVTVAGGYGRPRNYLVPKHPATVRSRNGQLFVGMMKKRTLYKKSLFTEMSRCQVNGVDTKPLRAFGEKGLKRAELDLKFFDTIKFDTKFYGID